MKLLGVKEASEAALRAFGLRWTVIKPAELTDTAEPEQALGINRWKQHCQ